MRLHLGVVDVAYSEPVTNYASGKTKITTTSFVAQVLEDNYHPMRVFTELYEKQIADAIAEKLVGLLSNPNAGRSIEQNGVFFPKIEKMFRNYLDKGEWDKVSLQPTQAGLSGVSHRKKKPFAQANPTRPSFIDTGLYQSTFRAWLTPHD